MQTIDLQIGRSEQVIDYREILEGPGETKLRVSISTGTSKEQCFAKVYHWDGLRWETVHAILTDNMATPPPFGDQAWDATMFQYDRNHLIRVATAILT